MRDPKPLEDLVDYLARTTGLTRSTAVRVLEEVLGFLDELPEEFICRRHLELQREGAPNAKIFAPGSAARQAPGRERPRFLRKGGASQ